MAIMSSDSPWVLWLRAKYELQDNKDFASVARLESMLPKEVRSVRTIDLAPDVLTRTVEAVGKFCKVSA